METTQLALDRTEARRLYREYRKHQHYSTPLDDEIRRTYQLIAQGRVIIQAIASIAAAGLGADGLPKLAICRADQSQCYLEMTESGRAFFYSGERTPLGHEQWRVVRVETPNFQTKGARYRWNRATAIVPPVPIHLRPKRGLANYHILWEAEWTRIPPRDPLLLRRIGKGDMWLVVAAWDLTEVERAALAARLNG